jgi:hypothetical protein
MLLHWLLNLLLLVQTTGRGSVEGWGYDAKTGKGLPYAIVEILDYKTGASTDTSGYYRIDNVPAGE